MSSEFYQIDSEDKYRSQGNVLIEANVNDIDYPVTVCATLPSGEEIGLTLDRADLKRLVAEAWVAGII